MSKEEWRDINGFYGYKISNYGRLKNKHGRILKNSWSKDYKIFGLSKNNKKTYKYVHRLVAEAFLDNPNNKPQVNHINGKKMDNRQVNLEWCTSKENINHAHSAGLKNHAGEKNQASILTSKKVLWARENKKLLTYAELGALFGVSVSCIRHAVKGKSWAHII